MIESIRSIAPVPTPLDLQGEFDPTALARHLGWLARETLDGALILGSNGEFPSFSLVERLRIAENAADAGSGLRLILGVGSCALGDVSEMVRCASGLGYSGVLCPPPFYFRAAPTRGVADFFKRVLDLSSLPVLLYHIPQLTGIAISDALLDAIGAHDNLAGVKDSSGDESELTRLASRFRDRSYYVGTDRLVRRCLDAGGSGSISAAASVVPTLVAAVGRDAELQPRLDAVRDLLEEYGLGPSVKAILRWMGFGDYTTRPPLEGLDPRREQRLLERFAGLSR
jgi:dihydrodipicolinate synthase/N-acetylneuraminate lyase